MWLISIEAAVWECLSCEKDSNTNLAGKNGAVDLCPVYMLLLGGSRKMGQ